MIDEGNIDYRSWANRYYKLRRLGKTDRDASDAYANRIIYNRDEWIKKNKVDSNKKNIVIMAHCFSDDANTTTSRSIYRDYYQWLICTLEIIQKIDNVNWLLRAHPGRGVYNEGDYVYKIFEKYAHKGNIYILEDDISSESLYDIIDGAVTVLGTCGLEFSSFGIPVVCAGLASYGGFGFTFEPKTEVEYVEYLSNMDKLERLSDTQIDMARKVSYDSLFTCSLKMEKEQGNDFLIKELNKLYENGIKETDSYFYKMARGDN